MTIKNPDLQTQKILPMLSDIGLTTNDSIVYLELQKRGVAFGGAKLASVLQLHRQYVYNSLLKLLSLGLVEELTIKGHRKYSALPPNQITKLARRKLDDAESLERELKSISMVGAEQDFEVYIGEKQVMDYEMNLVKNIPLNASQYIIGGSSDIFIQFFGDLYDEFADIVAERGLQSYYIACPEEMPWPEKAHQIQKSFEYKVLPNLPRTVVSTVVRFDTVVMYSMVNPPLVYVIKSKRVADDYKKFFDMLWKMG